MKADSTLLRSATGPAALDETVHASIDSVLQSPGRLLDAGARAFFEPRFGHDFSRVRVHDDTRAAASAEAINGLAYTVGSHVVFGPGQYAPHTNHGRTLLAHELTHVVQQGAAGHSTPQVVRRKTPPPPISARTRTLAGRACDVDQQRTIDSASARALSWLATALRGIDALLGGAKTKEAQAAAGALSTHFHVTDPDVARYVRTRIETIQADLLSRVNLTFECPPASDSDCGPRAGSQEYVAVVPDANPNEINLCGAFFERGVDDDASTLIHEMGHAQLGLRAPQQLVDRGYKSDAYYFYLTPGEAMTNAESYAMFVRQVATGSSPVTKGIADYLRDGCPDAWFPIIADAMGRARAWNHRAAVQTPAQHRFSRAYKVLDVQLHSGFTFKCITDGGGRCSDGYVTYWYSLGDMRICPSFIAMRSPDQRALAMLASLYAFQSLISGDAKQDQAALEARDIHMRNAPSVNTLLDRP